MNSSYSLSHLSDATLRDCLAKAVAAERTSTSVLLAHIAEFDARRLYAPEGFTSMREYCIQHLHLSEGAASKRIYAAHAARRFPLIFEALADGRLHLSAIVTLGSHLREETSRKEAEELLVASFHKSRQEIELLLAHRYPQAHTSPSLLPVCQGPGPVSPGLAPFCAPSPSEGVHAPGHAPPHTPPPRVTPVGPQCYDMRLTLDQQTFDDLQRLYELLSPTVRTGDVAEVLRRSFRALIRQVEARKYGLTDRPRKSKRKRSSKSRHIPAEVRRAVVDRDGHQCTFRSDSGRRCSARHGLESDHIEPVARGGTSTVDNLRLRCRAHNQYEAERTFGAEFMKAKRDQAEERRRQAAAREQTEVLIAALRRLGYSATDAKRAAEFAASDESGTTEGRVRKALAWFRPRALSVSAASASP
jgi:5-methylcytosine-specific restriction endonuclease McrA